jgi:hypothetical protein
VAFNIRLQQNILGIALSNRYSYGLLFRIYFRIYDVRDLRAGTTKIFFSGPNNLVFFRSFFLLSAVSFLVLNLFQNPETSSRLEKDAASIRARAIVVKTSF